MSGLKLFFRAFLPNQKNCDDKDDNPTAGESIDEDDLYNQSISQRPRGNDDGGDGENGDENDEHNKQTDANINSQIQYPNCSSTMEETSFYSTYTAPIDWKTWNEHQKEVLAKFMEERLFDNDRSNDSHSVSNESHDEQSNNESSELCKNTLENDEDKFIHGY
jgi:hypothetical protein